MKLVESLKTHTNNEFIKKAEEKHKDSNNEPLYDYSKTNYIGAKYPVTIICKKCGNEFIQRASHHTNGTGCPKCANKKLSEFHTSNTADFIKKAIKIHKDKYNYDNVVYINNMNKVLLHCNKCNSDFLQQPQSHLSGNGCPKCARLNHSAFMSHTTDKFIEKARKIHIDNNGNYLYDYSKVDYNGSNHTVIIICKKCKKEFLQSPKHHLNGSGCSNCYKSRAEKFIETQLILKNINFDTQKRFSDCKNKIALPFDFYLSDYNICIEFDGTHHYEIKRTHGGFDRLIQQRENDKIKTKYCNDNNITLYRIKYTDNLKDSIQDIFDFIKHNFNNEI
jgi:formylmethanofuran dehydrogenase subunit E/very-short-patch-repair endonuclease